MDTFIYPRYWRTAVETFQMMRERPLLWQQIVPRFTYQGSFQMSFSLRGQPDRLGEYAVGLRGVIRDELLGPRLASDFLVVADERNNPPSATRLRLDIYIQCTKSADSMLQMIWETMTRQELQTMHAVWVRADRMF